MKLTRNQVENVPAGREMNALIAENVMGLVPCKNWYLQSVNINGDVYFRDNNHCKHEAGKCYPRGSPPGYSENISAAYQVVEVLLKRHKFVEVTSYDCGHHACEISYTDIHEEADTVPLAICHASLLEVMEAK